MFKFLLGVLFAVALMNPQAAKDFLASTVDVIHNTSTVAVAEGSRLAKTQNEKIAGKAEEISAEQQIMLNNFN